MIKEIIEPKELLSAYTLLKDIRPHFDYEGFLDILEKSQIDNGYKLLGLASKTRMRTTPPGRGRPW